MFTVLYFFCTELTVHLDLDVEATPTEVVASALVVRGL